MSRVTIVTDSTAELSDEEAEALGIVVKPLHIRLGTDVLTDGPQLRSAEFHRRMTKGKLPVTLLAPTAHEMGELYRHLVKSTDQILSIHAGGRFVPMVRSAREGRSGLLGQSHIIVLDSGFVSKPLGVVVRQAAQAAQRDLDLDTLVREVRGIVARTYCAFYVDSLEHLKRAGMMPPLQDTIGVAPNIKPLFIIEEGQVGPLQRLRNRGTPVERLAEFVAEFMRFEELAIVHNDLGAEAGDLEQHLHTLYPTLTIQKHVYGPALASFMGPSALGVTVFEGPETDLRFT
jgi:DegV family protein with EDD domain